MRQSLRCLFCNQAPGPALASPTASLTSPRTLNFLKTPGLCPLQCLPPRVPCPSLPQLVNFSTSFKAPARCSWQGLPPPSAWPLLSVTLASLDFCLRSGCRFFQVRRHGDPLQIPAQGLAQSTGPGPERRPRKCLWNVEKGRGGLQRPRVSARSPGSVTTLLVTLSKSPTLSGLLSLRVWVHCGL